MSSDLPEDSRKATLAQRDARFHALDQRESDSALALVRAGHPRRDAYRRLRRFFDELRFASREATRFYTYVDASEHSEYGAPELWVASEQRHLSPSSGVAYEAWLNDIVAHAWTESVRGNRTQRVPVRTGIDAGVWTVVTRNETLRDDLLEEMRRAQLYATRSRDVDFDAERFVLYPRDEAHVAAIRAVVDRAHLPQGVIDLRDGHTPNVARLPMSEKRFSCGAVASVTVEEGEVIAPLIPADDEFDAAKFEAVAFELIRCVYEGLSADAVRAYLANFVHPWKLNAILQDAVHASQRRSA